ncbi:MAG: hypothetical protein ACREOO_25630 [bacterium]
MRLYDELTVERTPPPEHMISATATEILRLWQQSVPQYQEEETAKKNLIHKILDQIEYHAARQRGVVTVEPAEIAEELQRLSVRALSAWYEAFLSFRTELLSVGQEVQGLRILDRPATVLRQLMQNDPDFDARQYIF